MQQQWPGHSPQVSAGDDRSVWGDGWWKGAWTDITGDPPEELPLGCLRPTRGCCVPVPGTMLGRGKQRGGRQVGGCEQKDYRQRRRCPFKNCGNL